MEEEISPQEAHSFLLALEHFRVDTTRRIQLQSDCTQHQFHTTWYYLERLLDLKRDLNALDQKERIIDSSFFTYEIPFLIEPFTGLPLSSIQEKMILESMYYCAFFLEYRNPQEREPNEKSVLGTFCLELFEGFIRGAQTKGRKDTIEKLNSLKKELNQGFRAGTASKKKEELCTLQAKVQEEVLSKKHLHILAYILTHEREKILSVDFQFETHKMITRIETRSYGRLRLIHTLLFLLSSGKLGICPVCSMVFMGSSARSKYCSKKHSSQAQRKKSRV
ncbi:hypothetical protein HOF92_15955 [bacterium]|jgi:hypothetical protein|nr:hypothetical protein [bacterium]